MPRLVLAPALVALAFLAPSATAVTPAPQLTDPAGDANFVNTQNGLTSPVPVPNNTVTPAGSQDYADVTAVQWQTLKTTKKVRGKTVTTVTGFSVTATLKAAPKPPDGTVVVYRMLGTTPKCGFFGVAYYSTPLSDKATPQSAIRDNCINATTRLTPLPLPVINGTSITWTVPLTAIPKDTGVAAGTALTGLWFTTGEIEDLKGQQVPSQSPFGPGATGFGYGVIDDSTPGAATFRIGS